MPQNNFANQTGGGSLPILDPAYNFAVLYDDGSGNVVVQSTDKFSSIIVNRGNSIQFIVNGGVEAAINQTQSIFYSSLQINIALVDKNAYEIIDTYHYFYDINGNQILAQQQAYIAPSTQGDQNAAVINAILTALQNHGLIASSI
jgi:hypothetical protein